MIRFTSIMSRIMFLHMIAMVVTAIILPLMLYWFMNSAATDLHHRAMHEQADAIARYLSAEPNGGIAIDLPVGLRDLYSEAYGRYAYAVLDDKGTVLFSSRSNGAPVFAHDDHASPVEFLDTRRNDRVIAGVSLRKDALGRKLWIQVGEDMSHRDVLIDDIVADFFQRVGWITLPILLMLLAIDIQIFRRALRPLLHASEQAAHVGPSRTDIRLPTSDIPKEILPLVIAVNQAFDRLEQGFRQQREFTADVAHELRTPLAVLRTRVETLPDKQVSEKLQKDIQGMTRVVSQLLDAAELETIVIDPSEKADLRGVCAEIAEFLAPLALAQGKAVALSGAGGPVWIKGNAEILRRAVRNLVENAINHTAPRTTVEIVVEASGTVTVADHGPGIPLAEQELVFRRFWRGGARHNGGAGLGLSIVRRIVEAHGGSVSVENRPSGGARFSVRLVRP